MILNYKGGIRIEGFIYIPLSRGNQLNQRSKCVTTFSFPEAVVMYGCYVLWWGVPATAFGVCVLVHAYIEIIFLHCFSIPQMVSSDGSIIFLAVSGISTAQIFFFTFPVSLQVFFKLCCMILILNLNSTNILRYTW